MPTRLRWVSSNPSPVTPSRADHVDFKRLLGTFATGVTVVTAVDEQGRAIGMTASAVTAVSLKPPLLLICVGKTARFHAAWDYRKGFALNVLAHGQEPLSEHFAKGVDKTFDGIAHTLHEYAETSRRQHMSALEERAGKQSAKIVLPLSVCLLPSALLLILGPAIIQLFEAFK